jgi:hypothetical protein
MFMGLAAWRLCLGGNDLVKRECVFERVSNFLIICRNEHMLVFLFLATLFLCSENIRLGDSVTAFPTFKISVKNGLFLGQMPRTSGLGADR